jgi:PadR family transcriptional regulator AphA
MSTEQLTATSYLVLGLLAREGPSTPYELKRHVAGTLGHFWSFPHTLLYGEPARLASLGLVTERREEDGRRRRVFTITGAGLEAIRAWLGRPSREPTELRDTGLLQLFFADLGPPEARRAIAVEQLAIHRAMLAGYEDDQRIEQGSNGASPGRRGADTAGAGRRTADRWRGETLRMGLLYERAAVAFWEDVAASDGQPGAAADRPSYAASADRPAAAASDARVVAPDRMRTAVRS